jgi:hypothetical protein
LLLCTPAMPFDRVVPFLLAFAGLALACRLWPGG